jgi:deazaflavin-dependent oxidoreductase (nitroreductase family)
VSESDATAGATIEDELAAWGKVIVLETRGRVSGRPRRVPIGFVATAAGWLVAAADEETRWARNLLAEPRCVVELGGTRQRCLAVGLEAAERHAAVTELILKYGTPSERLGGGPAFRLQPDDRGEDGTGA